MAKTNAPVIGIVTGLVLIALGMLAQKIMPLVGRAEFQAAAAGSYSPADYQLNLAGYYIVAVLVIGVGVVFLARDLYCKKC